MIEVRRVYIAAKLKKEKREQKNHIYCSPELGEWGLWVWHGRPVFLLKKLHLTNKVTAAIKFKVRTH